MTPNPIDKARGHEIDWLHVPKVSEAAQVLRSPCFVYFIGEEDGPLKIGKAVNPISRLRGMQTGNPRPLRVERLLVGDQLMEHMLHEMYREFAIYSLSKSGKVGAAPGTEWFRSEIRDWLFPAIDIAAERQCKRLAKAPVPFKRLTGIVKQAHLDRGHLTVANEELRLLPRV